MVRPNLLRELSEQEVLDEIFRRGPISRPEIASATNLSKATVGAAIERLELAGIIRAAGQQHGRRGRSPLAYEIRGNAGFVLGIDIGGTNIRAASADIFGAPVHQEQQLTSHAGARAVSAQVIEIAGRVVERSRATHERLLAAAVSTPGVVDQVSRRVTSLAYNVSPDGHLDPLAALRARFDMPVRIDNNVNLAALGESWEGLARNVPTFAFVSVGAGVGMGLVVDGELVRGAHGGAGEIGYLPSGRDPYDERHRLHGGLEDEIGAAAILQTMCDRTERSVGSVEEVFALARTGDENARAVVLGVARRLGVAIASVIAVIDPELIVLGGGIGRNPALLGPVRSTVAELVPLTARIEISRLGDQAALHGAIAVALREARTLLFTRAAR
jgi:predicted NBD/HSP70 family sugar kinase/biotin operon repressor